MKKTEFSYKKLWKLLIDRGMKKKELSELSGVSAASIAKLGRNGNVTTEVLFRAYPSCSSQITFLSVAPYSTY